MQNYHVTLRNVLRVNIGLALVQEFAVLNLLRLTGQSKVNVIETGLVKNTGNHVRDILNEETYKIHIIGKHIKRGVKMATYRHEWQCIYCGRRIVKQSTQENPPTPVPSGYCKSKPFGNEKAKCVLEKIR